MKQEFLNSIESGEIVLLLFKNMLNQCPTHLQTLLHDLNKGELGVLGYLTLIEDHVSAGILMDNLKVSSARIASVLNSLEKKEYIIREKSKLDKRKIVVSITSQGKEVFDKLKSQITVQFKKVVNEVGIDALLEYLLMTKRIQDILGKDGGSIC